MSDSDSLPRSGPPMHGKDGAGKKKLCGSKSPAIGDSTFVCLGISGGESINRSNTGGCQPWASSARGGKVPSCSGRKPF